MDVATGKTGSVRQTIIDATVELIRQHGVAGTSISDVIALSGTSAGAIYHHFGSKERLVLEVARSAVAVPMTLIMQTSTGLAPAELFRAALAQVSRNDHTAEVLLQVWAGAQSDPGLWQLLTTEVAAMRTGIITFVGAWCAEHSPESDAETVVSVLMSLVIGYAVQRGLGMILDPEAYRELGTRAIAAAVLSRPGSIPETGVPGIDVPGIDLAVRR